MQSYNADNSYIRGNDEAARSDTTSETSVPEAESIIFRLRRNSLAPIMQLPADLLLRILGEFRQEQRSSIPRHGVICEQPCSPASWIHLTHVSHHWRSVALQSPLLWTSICIPSMPSAWVGEFIRRSGSAPLTVFMECSSIEYSYWKSVQPLVTGTIDRIASFGCRDYIAFLDAGGSFEDERLNLSRSPLKALELVGCDKVHRNWKPAFDLQYLSIIDGSFDMAFISSELNTLELRTLYRATVPPTSKIYSMLFNLTHLRYLALEGVLATSTTKDEECINAPVRAISLPHLRSVHLEDEPEEECSRFLSCVTLSPCLARLHISLQPQHSSTLSSIKAVLFKLFSGTSLFSSPGLRRLRLGIEAGHRTKFVLYDLDDYREPRFKLAWADTSGANARLSAELIEHLPYEKVQALDLKWECPCTESMLILTEAVSRSNTLRKLTLRGGSLCNAFLNYTPSCDCIGNAHKRSLIDSVARQLPSCSLPACALCQRFAASLFPALRTLVLWTTNADDIPPLALNRFIAHRIDCGRPLASVIITCMNVGSQKAQETWEQLRRVGVVVQWDGVNNYSDDDEMP